MVFVQLAAPSRSQIARYQALEAEVEETIQEVNRAAVEMPPEERRTRMARMRQTVCEHNIYRWAGLLLSELARIPEEVLGVKGS